MTCSTLLCRSSTVPEAFHHPDWVFELKHSSWRGVHTSFFFRAIIISYHTFRAYLRYPLDAKGTPDAGSSGGGAVPDAEPEEEEPCATPVEV
jgi:hypothetical protein